MTTQEEMNEVFIATLNGIMQVCDKTTTGNVSHNIATIKCKCKDMLEFYKKYPTTNWHSVVDGELPQEGKSCLFYHYGDVYKGIMHSDKRLSIDDMYVPITLYINDIQYWMEIPKVEKEELK
jgi:hypothetical protein